MVFFYFKFIIPLVMFSPIYYNYTTQFEKSITVKNKYIGFNKNGIDKNAYMIYDIKSNIYIVGDQWWLGNFNKADMWNYLEENKNYKVKGYGIRIPFLNFYPIIYLIKNNDSK